jgi:hypothetical protein
MNSEYPKKSLKLQEKLKRFMEEHIYLHDADCQRYTQQSENYWKDYPKLEEWKSQAKVFSKYGTLEYQEEWLKPLMNGDRRTALVMSKPKVASSANFLGRNG